MGDTPSQPAPRQEPDPAMGDWAEALAVRARPPQVVVTDWSRRRVALIGIVIAVLFPFYQYVAQRALVRWELREVERAAEEALREAGRSAAANARQAQVERAARDQQARIASVRVVGVIDGNPPIVVVDKLPPEGAAEADKYICAQAVIWLRRRVDGLPLRVMRDRGDRPGTDAGRVVCPRA